ncbi:MAG: hypothetical protein ACR2IV_05140 [Bryobacteraceae bacterium]
MLSGTVMLAAFALAWPGAIRGETYLDLAPFAQLISWSGSQPHRFADLGSADKAENIGLEWDEERDVREVRVRFRGEAQKGAAVEYWFKNWPWEPPRMPSIEDPMDDPWQGEWLKAATTESCERSECRYVFEPLALKENARADRLPNVRYRRTLKVRISWPSGAPAIAQLQAFSDSEENPIRLRVHIAGNGGAMSPASFSVYNGYLRSAKPVARDMDLELVAAKPSLPGSEDLTVVTVHVSATPGVQKQNQSFSFCTRDLAQGPIEIPAFGARITEPGGPAEPASRKQKIRGRIQREPEQSYELARREIPPLDPWDREGGGKLYLPLAPDASWQKFAFEIGGNVFMSKKDTKAKGHELERLQWSGDRVTWKIGTGTNPYYREDRKCSIRKLSGYLPVGTQEWESEGLHYTEEAVATLLRGPLSPDDPARSEQTSAVLMLKLSATNSAATSQTAHVWISNDPKESLSLVGNLVSAGGHLRAQIEHPKGAAIEAVSVPISNSQAHGIHLSFHIQPRSTESVVIKLPFVSDLSAGEAGDLARLQYEPERNRVVAYWEGIVGSTQRFSVPEPKFLDLARSVVSQIHISAAKDPGTGLYILPAASYVYDAFENEAAYQILLLDTLGQKKTAQSYLETMLHLQGSKNFPGMQTGPPDAIFHGEKISDTYDYTASGYGLDHGTVLWALAQHYLYTRDRAWLEHAWPHMKKAIDWIVEQRKATKLTDVRGKKVREYGLLPASQLEDNSDWAHWFVINAYAWAGMTRTADALAEAGNPEAARVRTEADDYLRDLRNDVRRAVESAPVVRMQDGTYEPYVPVVPTRRFRLFGPVRRDYYQRYGKPDMNPLLRLGADRDTLCGPVLLSFLGVFDVNDPITEWVLNDWEDNETLSSGMGMNVHGMTDDRYWFSQGGMVFQANLVNPIPIYLRLHEVPAAIRTLYNDFVSGFYPDVNVFTEEYHQWGHGSGPFYKTPDEARFVHRLRDMLVLEEGDNLWLAAGAPRRWVTAKDGIRVDGVQTFFGPVSYTLRAGAGPGVIEGEVTLPRRQAPQKAWLIVRTPTSRIESVTINGKAWSRVDSRLEAVELPATSEPLKIQVHYR